MPTEWKRIAKESPILFEKMQDEFIHYKYYSPTLKEVRDKTGLDMEAQPSIFREVLWSTAVQHGPSGGARIFIKASKRAQGSAGRVQQEILLREIFREREKRLAKCAISQMNALKERLRQEHTIALKILRKPPVKTASLDLGTRDGLL